MADPVCTVSGRITLPDDSGVPSATLTFRATGLQFSGGDLVSTAPVSVALPETGSFEIDLIPNSVDTKYAVTLTFYNGTRKLLPEQFIGYSTVPTAASADFDEITVATPPGTISDAIYNASMAAVDRARAYATADEDVEADPVGHPGEFSARHYSLKAAASAETIGTLAELDARIAETGANVQAAGEHEAGAEAARDAAIAAALTLGAAPYQTFALMDAVTPADGDKAYVWDDGDDALLGLYFGAAGEWEKDALDVATMLASKAPLTAWEDTRDDAGVHVRATTVALAAGLTDPDQINLFLARGGYLDFAAGDFVLDGITRANANDFTALTVTRAASAYALNAAGEYVLFPADTLRATDRGALLEGAATQLLTQPVDLANAYWSKANATVTQVPGGGPSGICDAYDLVETASGSGTCSITRAITGVVGDYCFSPAIKRGDNRYALVVHTRTGHTRAVFIDFDAPGGATVARTSDGTAVDDFGVIALADGWYRVWFYLANTSTSSLSWTVQGAGGTTFASRTYELTAGNVAVRIAAMQLEQATSPSSPILAGGTTRPADAMTIDWAGTNAADAASIAYEGGIATIARSAFGTADVVDLVEDGSGVWLSKYITSISLIPAMPAAYRPLRQSDDDHASALVAAAVSPIREAVGRLLASTGLGGLSASVPGFEQFAARNGLQPYMVAGPDGYYWQGRVYGTEAAMLEASGGVRDGQTVTWGYWSDGIDLLGGVDFASDTGGFVGTGGGAVASVSGELQFTSSSLPDSFSRELVGYGGRALRYAGRCRRGTAANTVPAFTRLNNYFGNGKLSPSLTATAMVDFALISSPGNGIGFWIGGLQQGGGSGTAFYDDLTLTEVWPAHGFPQGTATWRLSGVAPADLPASAQVLLQLDTDDNSDRLRLEWRTDGALVWIRDYYFGKSTGASRSSVQIGTLAAGAAFDIAVGHSRTQLHGAVNGAGAGIDIAGTVGVSHMRIGRSYSGEAFGGAITGWSTDAGCDSLSNMIRDTGADASLPYTAKQSLMLILNGDSYMEASSSGVGMALEDLGYTAINISVGGSTSAGQAAARAARTDLNGLPNTVEAWWDGSPNGFVDQATARAEIASWVASLGHNRWVYIRSGQIPNGTGISLKSEMDALYAWVSYTYGPQHVHDAQPATVRFAVNDPGNAAYTNDQADLARGSYPRSATYDDTHLNWTVRRAIALDMAGAIERVRAL